MKIMGKKLLFLFVMSLIGCTWQLSSHARAEGGGGFSVQVSPSPLIAKLTPGKQTILDLRINNTGPQKEKFIMELRDFSVSEDTGEVEIASEPPELIESFVSFDKPTFTLESGEWLTQKVIINTPESAGFSYNFAIIVKRDGTVIPENGGAALQGSVAVFTLLNVDRPDAVSKLEIEKVVASRRVYEYLPSELTITLKNTGNTIVAPKGNIFFSRKENDPQPIDAIIINETGGNILPGSSRTFTVKWDNGFPVWKEDNGQNKLVWDYSKLSSLRIGRYTGKVVAIYDDGSRDVPLEGAVSFWVLPWKILGVIAIIVLILCIGIFTLLKKAMKLMPKKAKPEEK